MSIRFFELGKEVEKLLDALSQPVLNAAPAAVPDVEPVEKIRRRVEKNVENEIHQIEDNAERCFFWERLWKGDFADGPPS